MTTPQPPLLVEADDLENCLDETDVLVVDLCKADQYRAAHIPGAVHLEYSQIVAADKPAMGLLPEEAHLSKVFSSLGMTPEAHVVAYDDEGGGRACRLLWTLEVGGHRRYSLLNGGLHAWANENHALSRETPQVEPVDYRFRVQNPEAVADRKYILAHLEDPGVALLDARTAEEFAGTKRFAERGGHIPGAANLDWLLCMDRERNLRMLAPEQLRGILAERGIEPDQEVIVYCQTHHRSAYTYIMLKALGYERVRGYPGSWSEWGNRDDTPVATRRIKGSDHLKSTT